MKKVKSAFLLVFLLACGHGLLQWILRPKRAIKPVMIAHRGAAGLAPENTLAAMRAGLEHGARLMEVDVQRSADGTLLLMHDRTVERTTNGQGTVGRLSWAAIGKLDAGSHFSPAFAGEPVPRLEAVLKLVAESGLLLVLEAKLPDLYPGIEQQLGEAIYQAGVEEQVVLVSFEYDCLERFHRLWPDIPIGHLVGWLFTPPADAPTQFIVVNWTNMLADPTLVYRIHRRNYGVWVWTVNHPLVMRWLAWRGVDGIITDRPDLWPEALNED